MTDHKAEMLFRKIRWSSTNGKPVCPTCGGLRHYNLSTRNVWKCKYCSKQFSATSGTLFAGHKLPIKTYLNAISIFATCAKGMSAVQFARKLNIQYKTGFVLMHKIREALLETRDESPMEGICEMDGAYVNTYVRPANNIEDRIDRRLAENQNPKKRCVIVVRQRGDGIEFIGSVRTLTYVLHGETAEGVREIARRSIVRGSEVHTDEANAYDPLHALYDMRRVNHSVEYFSEEKAYSNQAESYFSRMRRFEEGQIHHCENLYLSNYANEMAYREDTRRMSTEEIFNDVCEKCTIVQQSNE